MALQGDGKIVVVGFIGDSGGGDFALARYNTNGSLDTSFSGDGKQTTNFGGTDDGATGVAVQSDGKIVVVGGASGAGTGGRDFAIARYNPNGTLDTSFSGDGKQTTGFAGFGGANGVALQANGKIVAAGVGVSPGVGTAFGLARYNSDGSLDTSFSGDGKQTTDFAGGLAGATGVALQGDGKIVAVGEIIHSPGGFALARYNPNGSLDTSFSGDGKQTTDFGRARRRGERGGAPGERQDRRGGPLRRPRCRCSQLRARPLQPERLARHELLRRRQADDRLRGPRRGERGGAPRRTARSSPSGSGSVPTSPTTSRLLAIWEAEPRAG